MINFGKKNNNFSWNRFTPSPRFILETTVEPVYKDHPRKCNIMVVVNGWSLIAGSFMQNMSDWETNSVAVIYRELLFYGGL